MFPVHNSSSCEAPLLVQCDISPHPPLPCSPDVSVQIVLCDHFHPELHLLSESIDVAFPTGLSSLCLFPTIP